MGDNEVTEAKAIVTAKPEAIKEKKKEKKPDAKANGSPHVTGRIMELEVSSSGVAFKIKSKKGKPEAFSLNEMEFKAIPAAAAFLSAYSLTDSKVRIEFAEANDGKRAVKRLSVHS